MPSADNAPAWPPEIDLFWEDFELGRVFPLGSHLITESEILEFARRFDPQPFHVDPELALTGPFGGLIASGWHTCAIWMRLYYDGVLRRSASLGSPGVEDVRWLSPVRPGDLLSGSVEVRAARPSRSRPDRGLAQLTGELLNQERLPRLRLTAWGLFARRARSEPG
ncbi:MAG: MaoC family dehydratase [Candidatus Dormibacteria bacterium]